MTAEVAKKIARGIADKIECNTADMDDWAEFWGFTREEYEEFLDMAIKASGQKPNTWSLDDAREDFMYDVYNTLDFLETNDEANRIIDSFDRFTSDITQQPCEDCISREAVDEYITNLLSGYLYDEERTRLEDLTAYIWELPSVTPQQKIGHWILLDECSNSGYYCSECHKKVIKEGWSNTVKKVKYCPNCGAKMAEMRKRNEKKEKSQYNSLIKI